MRNQKTSNDIKLTEADKDLLNSIEKEERTECEKITALAQEIKESKKHLIKLKKARKIFTQVPEKKQPVIPDNNIIKE